MLPSEYFWAFHSDCTEELLTMIPSVSRGEPTWSDLRAHGVGWWVKSNGVLRRTMEKVRNEIMKRLSLTFLRLISKVKNCYFLAPSI